MILFKFPFQVSQRSEPAALELVNPAILNLIERDWIQVVQLLPAAPDDGDEIGVREQLQVLRHGLARHVHVLAQRGQRLAVIPMQLVEQTPARRIGQGFEDFVEIALHGVSIICK